MTAMSAQHEAMQRRLWRRAKRTQPASARRPMGGRGTVRRQASSARRLTRVSRGHDQGAGEQGAGIDANRPQGQPLPAERQEPEGRPGPDIDGEEHQHGPLTPLAEAVEADVPHGRQDYRHHHRHRHEHPARQGGWPAARAMCGAMDGGGGSGRLSMVMLMGCGRGLGLPRFAGRRRRADMPACAGQQHHHPGHQHQGQVRPFRPPPQHDGGGPNRVLEDRGHRRAVRRRTG
jgi:hypothetical protein